MYFYSYDHVFDVKCNRNKFFLKNSCVIKFNKEADFQDAITLDLLEFKHSFVYILVVNIGVFN